MKKSIEVDNRRINVIEIKYFQTIINNYSYYKYDIIQIMIKPHNDI